MRAPDAIAFWSCVNSIVIRRIGSKNLSRNTTNAKSTPTWRSPSITRCPPNTITKPIDAIEIISIGGISIPERKPPRMAALR